MNIRVRWEDSMLYAVYLAIFKIHTIPQGVQQAMKVVLLLYAAYLIVSIKKPKYFLNLVLIIGASIMLSSILGFRDGVVESHSISNGFLYFVCLFELYIILSYYKDNDEYARLTNNLFGITSLICMISLISIAIRGGTIYGTEITYFFGSKFMTSYLFILWLCLFECKYKDSFYSEVRFTYVYIMLAVLIILICLYIHCVTAIVGIVTLVILRLIPSRIKVLASNPIAVLVTMIVIGLFPFYVTFILDNRLVVYVVTEVFGKNLNLTGRTIIFRGLYEIISIRPWFGYGYGNNAVADFISFGNAQNGLMQYAVNYGLIGVSLFLVIIVFYLRTRIYSERKTGWYSLLYSMIICSAVEISYNYIFFLALFMIGCFWDVQSACLKDE